MKGGYIAKLNATVERDKVRRAQQKEADLKVAAERLTPLVERLANLLATIPIENQREGLSLAALQESLRGRRRGHAHPGELGAALRKLGFERRRRWSGDNGFEARWHLTRESKHSVRFPAP
ncbi:hypothetical protein [Rhodoblastus sp.]|uniref:hypothetical protein n=1 Tax=Rhodoblastus sp. TaxID=1962975 RepID=UPI003F980D2F